LAESLEKSKQEVPKQLVRGGSDLFMLQLILKNEQVVLN